VGDELETMSIALTDITQAACACHSLFSWSLVSVNYLVVGNATLDCIMAIPSWSYAGVLSLLACALIFPFVPSSVLFFFLWGGVVRSLLAHAGWLQSQISNGGLRKFCVAFSVSKLVLYAQAESGHSPCFTMWQSPWSRRYLLLCCNISYEGRVLGDDLGTTSFLSWCGAFCFWWAKYRFFF
jgi:hypothetical protein